jgi:aryl-alcohol dehydrogenase-like predicted oxidoreductase
MLPRFELAPGRPVPRLIRGTFQLHEAARRLHRSAIIDDLIAGCEAGFTAIEAADLYDGVEELLGEARGAMGSGRELRVHTRVSQIGAAMLTPGEVRLRVDASRRRLRQDRLDLVQLQWWNLDLPGWLDVGATLAELRGAGAIAEIGVANFPTRAMTAMLDAGVPLVSNQVQLSLIDRRASASLVPACRAHGIHILGYGPLAGGFLSDAWLGSPEPGMRPAASQRFNEVYRMLVARFGGWSWLQSLLAALHGCATRHEVDIAAIALAWLLQKGEAAALIVGAASTQRLSNYARAALLALGEDDIAAIDEVLALRPPVDDEIAGIERRTMMSAIAKSYAARGQ